MTNAGRDRSKEISFYMPWSGGRLYATAHLPQAPQCNRGAVLIGPYGSEHACAQRVLVNLCRHLAHRGVACIRFDPPGLGESDGDALYNTLDALCASAQVVAAEFKRLSSVREIAWLGVRLGALLASRLVRPTEPIFLVDPVVQGSTLLQQLRFASRVNGRDHDSAAATCLFEAGGTRYSPEMVGELNESTLLLGDPKQARLVLSTGSPKQRQEMARDLGVTQTVVLADAPRFWMKRDVFVSSTLNHHVARSLSHEATADA